MKKTRIKLMCASGVFAAIIFIFTAYIHIPVHTGYVHIGDGIIYLAASILPLPYAVFAGACGAALADFLSGYALWAPASIIIKAVTVLLFTQKNKKIICAKNLIALIPSLIICTGGYYLYEAILTQNLLSPLAGIVGNIIQASLSSLFFVILGLYLDKFKIKEHL